MFKNLGGGPKCQVCEKTVYFNEKVMACGNVYHKACFKCTECSKRLEVGKQGEHKNKPYCMTCYNKKYGPRGYGFGIGAGVLTETGVRKDGRSMSVSSTHTTTSKKKKSTKTKKLETAAEEPEKTTDKRTSTTKRTSTKRSSMKKRNSIKKSSEKPFKKEFKGTKWSVDHATKEQGVVDIQVDSIAHTVFIYGANNATLVIHGKCNSIAMDKCVKTQVVFDATVSAVEVSNCKSMKLQIKDFSPTVAIDNTDGCLVYLSEKCVEKQDDFIITAAKSSEMNVSFPDPNSTDGDYVELPLPEQFKYQVEADGNGNAVVNATESDLYSG